jgi:bifunctional DNase/RNase
VLKVVVNDLRDNTFFAVLHLQLGAAEITVDARPSDAIALALRVGAPIFVDEAVVTKAQMTDGPKEQPEAAAAPPEDPDKVKEWLESIKPGDFMERGKDPGAPSE